MYDDNLLSKRNTNPSVPPRLQAVQLPEPARSAARRGAAGGSSECAGSARRQIPATLQLVAGGLGAPCTMASEKMHGSQGVLDLSFQSLAMKHIDLKQVELDTAAAKVDELSRQLETLWTDSPGQTAGQPKVRQGRETACLGNGCLVTAPPLRCSHLWGGM
ncbi:protein phosphatase 1, regulatory (inhibitor) subunit 13 like [Chelydra serpentina]|uniref:Protein phosphatase 1, regulatory (Inhibitor) subunit 13 like n=1 Tax=Chelydra serpentina TaxID=8475 RepID=A0A8T1S3D2_CHESE|nr:protein phosphatase 1, regulatory (inhibitor) subunit 13 like [Chelydra serpentina]